MRRRLVLPLLFAAAVAAATVPAGREAAAQGAKSRKVSFQSVDEAKLVGTLTASAKGGNSPTVILLHGYKADPTKGDWGGLAATLAAEGFNVFRFDFRGHGASTIVDATKFWLDPLNARYMAALARKRPPKDEVKFADFADKTGYFPRLADDLMAARVELDKLNDKGEVNTSSVYLIGEKEMATLGMLYIAAEWRRPAIHRQGDGLLPLFPARLLPIGSDTAGKDIAGCVWLSPARHPSVTTAQVQQWVSAVAPEMREKTPMLFLHGEQDTAGAAGAKFFYNDVLVAKPKAGSRLSELKLTYSRAVKKTKLAGVGLLGAQLDTEKLIVEYLKELEKERQNPSPLTRTYPKPPAILFPEFGVCRN